MLTGRLVLNAVAMAVLLKTATGTNARAAQPTDKPAAELPSARDMASARRDLWGEAAIRRPDGPSYAFYRDLLPPLRYVNTDFRHYPIVLSAPLVAVKARWVSNGSAVNARANKKPMWREVGTPVTFHVGAKAEPYGLRPDKLDGPRYADGYLPLVQSTYRTDITVEQEAFGGVRGAAAEHGGVLMRFTVRARSGTIAARVQSPAALKWHAETLRNGKDQAIVVGDRSWQWHADGNELRTILKEGQSAVLLVFTKPVSGPLPPLTATTYDEERAACVDRWQALLARGMKLEVPEPLVNNAWRALVIGNYLIAVDDRMNYSAGNAYDHLYEGECGDAVRSLMLFGFTQDARRMVGPLLDFERKATRFHVAGHKLQLLTHYYWTTRDADYMREREATWKSVADFIVSSRKTANGLLPKDNYAGDISQQVYSLNSNANCWRGLRDLGLVLEDMGDRARAEELAREAAVFRKAILDAVAKSQRRDAKPPFLPMSLFGAEEPYDVLTASRLGSYYNLMAPYVIGSEVFGPGSERENWMMEYPRQHGGLAMGMIRSMPHQGEFNQQPGVNVLYGQRYMLAQLRRDERDRALAGFYGQLAQGMTRDTFIGGEGSRFFHGDEHGRSFYLPPNSASNAMFLTTLRYLLIQDWDLDGDGRPETLRLLYGAPGRWLKDGAVINVEGAPTMFGEVSFRVESRLSRGEVVVKMQPPPRPVEHLSLRLPLPPGWKVTSARVADREQRPAADGAVVLAQREPCTIRFGVEKSKP